MTLISHLLYARGVSKYIITYCLRKSQIFGEKWKIEGVYKTVW